ILIFGVMIGLVLWGHSHKIDEPATAGAAIAESDAPPRPAGRYESWAHAGRDGKGADLDAPADPARPYPARPEWYFLFLFQLLKYFEGEEEIYGTVIIPNAVFVGLALLPLLGYGFLRRIGHFFAVVYIITLLS